MAHPRLSSVRRAAIRPRRLAAGAAFVLAGTLIASACDSSPVAVSVNSQQIQQTRLNADLRSYSDNAAFVKSFEAQSQGVTVRGVGQGTYSSSFVAGVLNDVVVSTALHQYLAAHDNLPSAPQVAAARAWQSALEGSAWLSYPPSFRDQQAENAAEDAQFVSIPANKKNLRTAVNAASGYLFSLVCVRQVGFTARTADGQPDYPASLAAAKAAVADGSLTGGAVTCYSPPTLENQGNPFYDEVIRAKVGRPSAPHRTKFGYRVLEVTDRHALPFNAALQRVTAQVVNQESGGQRSALEQRIVTSARVWLNPEYGTWDPKQGVRPHRTAGS